MLRVVEIDKKGKSALMVEKNSGRCVEGRMGRSDDVPTQEVTLVSTVSRSKAARA